MPIDPKEIKNIEDSMVHDKDEEPHPEGWGVYLTLRFLSKLVLSAYGLMLLGLAVIQVLLRNSPVPLFLRPEATLLLLPIVLVAVYFYYVTDHEPELAKKRTPAGKLVSFVLVYLGMQAISIGIWIAFALAFRLK